MRNIPERLRDIQDAIVRIMKYTQEGRYRYDHDELVQTWVTHNLYVIGEAARAVASDFPDFKDQHCYLNIISAACCASGMNQNGRMVPIASVPTAAIPTATQDTQLMLTG